MKFSILNYTEESLYISDINITIPPLSKGCAYITEEQFMISSHLIKLVNDKKIRIFSGSSNVRTFHCDGMECYSIDGNVIWQGDGKTKPENSLRNFSSVISDDLMDKKRNYIIKLPKRYKIIKNIDSNVSVEKISTILTKISPTKIIDEDIYLSKEIQTSISNGFIKVCEIMSPVLDDLGNVNWISGDIDQTIGTNESNCPSEFTSLKDNSDEFSGVQCIWEGPIFDTGGYANMNRQYVLNLSKMGVKVKPILFKTSNQIEPLLKSEIVRLSEQEVVPNSPKVYATNVPNRHFGHNIAYTMMETEGVVHRNLVNSMAPANELWVPSEWNKEVFLKSGVKKPIKVMPLAIEEDFFKPRCKRVAFNFPTKNYIFYSSSTWLWRKGFDVLLQAYSKAFSADDDVTLIIFTHVPLKSESDYLSAIKKDINSWISNGVNLPHLVIINSFLPQYVMPYIYNSVDCYVQFTRGEGWGLPYCEAIASGVPVIGADHGGQKMFLNNDNSLLVKPDKIVPCHGSLLPISPFYQGMNFVSYSSVAISEASSKMRYAFENKDKMKILANKCRKELLEKYTWRKSARRVAERLREIG